ncbi:hypothetical protein SEA_NAMAGO_105 [Microbacterium phage Namago]|nr:hypothetical protein SEA_NAMAGO_105 [Microbacterium phage Namago]
MEHDALPREWGVCPACGNSGNAPGWLTNHGCPLINPG